MMCNPIAFSNAYPGKPMRHAPCDCSFKRFEDTVMDGNSTTAARHPAANIVHMLGVGMANVTMQEALAQIASAVEFDVRKSFAFVNADCLNQAAANPAYARVLSRQAAVFADGSGIRLAARLRGVYMKDNVNGTDLFPLLCAWAAREGHGLFLLGARDGIAAEVARRMQADYPGLIISGTQHGYYPPQDEDKVIEAINASGARICVLSLGAPKQELLADALRTRCPDVGFLCVGAALDFISGHAIRAPLWMRRARLEWFWRMINDPLRLTTRYALCALALGKLAAPGLFPTAPRLRLADRA